MTNAINNQYLLGKIYHVGSAGLTMAEVRRMYVPSDDLDKQSYLREYINATMVDGEKPEMYSERMCIIKEKLAEVGISKSEHETNFTFCCAFGPTMSSTGKYCSMPPA